VLNLPKGSVKSIIANLDKQKFNVASFDHFIVRFVGRPQSGWVNLGATNMTRLDFYKKLTTAKAALTTVTLVPGETTEYFFKQVSAQLELDYDKLLKAFRDKSPFFEGYLTPESYLVPLGIDEVELVSYLLKKAEATHKEIAFKLFGEFNTARWKKILVIASVIQKESAGKSEHATVASVIFNRLRIGMPLQMDGTLNYGLHSHEKITAERIKTDTSSYNTYKNAGLPKEPVCNPSVEAILAAINPAKTDYLYFVRDLRTGMHTFSATYGSHKSAVDVNKNIIRKERDVKR